MALETRPYGGAGDKVTVIGLGGTSLSKHSLDEGVATVHRALELGVTYFDTSPAYGNGMNQGILGYALDGRPEEYLVATKLNMWVLPRFRSYDALRAQLDDNLTSLRRDSVDTLQIHESDRPRWWTDTLPDDRHAPLDPDYDFAAAPVMEVLRDAKDEGLCRFTGVTGNTVDGVGLALANVDVDVCLTAFNYDILRRRARRELIPLAKDRNMTIVLGAVIRLPNDVPDPPGKSGIDITRVRNLGQGAHPQVSPRRSRRHNHPRRGVYTQGDRRERYRGGGGPTPSGPT